MSDATRQLAERLRKEAGRNIGSGEWLEIDQERISRFAEVTGDIQWIHVDPLRAAAESPYGSTVAHGFLTLSLLPLLTGSNTPQYLAEHYPGMRYRVNYGLNRVRFPSPVPPGSRIRAHTFLKEAEEVGEGVQIVHEVVVEIEGKDKPACIAEQVVRVYP